MKFEKICKLQKGFVIVIMIIMLLLTSSKICLAAGGGGAISSTSMGGKIDTDGVEIGPIENENEFIDFADTIIGFIQWIGSAISVIVIAIAGIKYMTASIEGKAEYKKTLIYYMIGSLLVFGAVNILSMVYNALAE